MGTKDTHTVILGPQVTHTVILGPHNTQTVIQGTQEVTHPLLEPATLQNYWVCNGPRAHTHTLVRLGGRLPVLGADDGQADLALLVDVGVVPTISI